MAMSPPVRDDQAWTGCGSVALTAKVDSQAFLEQGWFVTEGHTLPTGLMTDIASHRINIETATNFGRKKVFRVGRMHKRGKPSCASRWGIPGRVSRRHSRAV